MAKHLPDLPPIRKPARPWDLVNPNVKRVDDEIQKARMDACNNCEFLFKLSKQCRKCGCFMEAKTTLPHAYCPIGKWDAVEPEDNLDS